MTDPTGQATIESVLREERVFAPPPAFSGAANVASRAAYDTLYRRALDDPEGFWADMAGKLRWSTRWQRVLEWQPPFAKWFVGGTLNIADNCLDRHLEGPRRNKAALIWVGEPEGETRVLTYQALHREVCRFANVLRGLGVRKGDRVGIYLPMIPEAAIAMLACARIGATHSVVFGGFSADALRDRMNDAQASVVVTADGGWRRGAIVPLKANVDDALAEARCVKDVVVVRRTGESVPMQGRDHWYHELMEAASAECPPEPLDSEHPLFILYTGGTTGTPKGVVHTTGGYLLHAACSVQWVFDLKEEDTFWCTADIGWVTGHSYVVYGLLANGATSVMYEGAPNHPQPDRFWRIIDDLGVTVFYTAPTAVRAFVKWGEEWPRRHGLGSLRLLGSVGEPINPEAWMWYHRVIGKERCPIVDTWWQTETGGIMIAPLPGAIPTKPGSATLPLPGIVPEIRSREGAPLPANQGGYLVVTRPWPGMLRTVYGDPERYRQQYWSQMPGIYFTGDGARCDEDGYFWVMGRIDDVVNVAGHRLGTMEVESALVSHPSVAEAAVVGRPDDLKGQAIAAFVTLESGHAASEALRKALKEHVTKEIGAFARPDDIRFTDALPKTRSGKIMRRLLRDIAAGKETAGDTTTLEDYSVLARLREDEE